MSQHSPDSPVTQRVENLLREIALSTREFNDQGITNLDRDNKIDEEYSLLTQEEVEQFNNHCWTDNGIITMEEMYKRFDQKSLY